MRSHAFRGGSSAFFLVPEFILKPVLNQRMQGTFFRVMIPKR